MTYDFKKFKSYFGSGPYAQYIRTKNYQEYKNENTDGSYSVGWSVRENNSIYIGATILAGIEGNLLSYLSIFAEYEFTASYGWVENKYTDKSYYNDRYIKIEDGTRRQVELQKIKLGLILYL